MASQLLGRPKHPINLVPHIQFCPFESICFIDNTYLQSNSIVSTFLSAQSMVAVPHFMTGKVYVTISIAEEKNSMLDEWAVWAWFGHYSTENRGRYWLLSEWWQRKEYLVEHRSICVKCTFFPTEIMREHFMQSVSKSKWNYSCLIFHILRLEWWL